uniref:Uncharacterized protein n=1 Tax=Sphaerodactylus townsendi TaxID=933632 RepID=A0ACB8FW88_9SAUR
MAPDTATGRLGPCLLALLMSLGASFVGSGGETCHNWTEGPESPTGAFRCPEKSDSADATFCCGPCNAPYCCSSPEIRLDQGHCPGGDQLIVSSVPPAIPGRWQPKQPHWDCGNIQMLLETSPVDYKGNGSPFRSILRTLSSELVLSALYRSTMSDLQDELEQGMNAQDKTMNLLWTPLTVRAAWAALSVHTESQRGVVDSLYSFYIALGFTAFFMSGCIAYIIYHEICLPLRARVRARLQVHEQATASSRVSFQDPSPTFVYNVASRLRGRNPPPFYHTCAVVQLSSLFPLDNRDPSVFSHTDTPAQPSQTDSGAPGDDAASSSSSALLDTAASDGSSKPEEYTTSPKQMGVTVSVSTG